MLFTWNHSYYFNSDGVDIDYHSSWFCVMCLVRKSYGTENSDQFISSLFIKSGNGLFSFCLYLLY